MEKRELTFTLERETKNTIRYQEQSNGQGPAIGTIYIQKWAVGIPAPQTLKVTVEAAE